MDKPNQYCRPRRQRKRGSCVLLSCQLPGSLGADRAAPGPPPLTRKKVSTRSSKDGLRTTESEKPNLESHHTPLSVDHTHPSKPIEPPLLSPALTSLPPPKFRCRHHPEKLPLLVSFRLLMFRPFVGEVLVGKISGYNEKGLHVLLDFFSDICIPGHLMQYGTARALDGRWMLKTEDGDELYLDIDDEGSIKGDGLGLLAWWAADEEEGEGEAEE
ncbi:hypothetical protein E2562_011114 [Oryza meyeriana var. granulata]|uniref:DNA-directed RNA polymerase subunit n=1 Tax=Oryza meyeriana var. granulata TaxID=110450 RepID=A0A6G1DG83_9ORYZ|nr:hypothetical protein E2562_011114 [Oryza meyeriana var. granulata]